MALTYADRVAESTVTVGTGDVSLAGPIDTDHDSFASQFADTETMPVVVFGGGKWMTFEGRYNSGSNSITRINFRDSSTGSPISLSGTMTVMCAWGAADVAAAAAAVAVTAAAAVAAAAVRYDTAQSLTSAQKNQAQRNAGIPPIMRSYLAGLTLSTAGSSSTFGVAAGVATDDTNADAMTLASAYTKTTSAWAVGSGNGSLDTGTIANSTWYHVHLIKRPDTGVVDVLLSLSATAPTLPSNYTLSRRIGSMKTNGSAQWVKFVQRGDEFSWDALSGPDVTFSGTTAVQAGTVNVPTGVIVNALLSVGAISPGSGVAGQGRAWIFPPDTNVAAAVASTSNFNVGIFTSALGSQLWQSMNVRTNAAATIFASIEITSMIMQVTACGWIDRRGRDS